MIFIGSALFFQLEIHVGSCNTGSANTRPICQKTRWKPVDFPIQFRCRVFTISGQPLSLSKSFNNACNNSVSIFHWSNIKAKKKKRKKKKKVFTYFWIVCYFQKPLIHFSFLDNGTRAPRTPLTVHLCTHQTTIHSCTLSNIVSVPVHLPIQSYPQDPNSTLLLFDTPGHLHSQQHVRYDWKIFRRFFCLLWYINCYVMLVEMQV